MSTALIVEDDADQAELASALVQLRRFETVVASTGGEGLELARRLMPDVILLDLMLPDTDGFEVCKALRLDRRTMTTPVVMVTALNDSENRQLGFRVGADAYVTKPYAAEDLYQAIDAARAWRSGLERARVQGEIHVEMDSQATFLQEVSDFLGSLNRTTPLSPEAIHQLRQAVMEMGSNAIEWGNRYNPDSLVRFTYRIRDDRVEIVVRDEGQGFDRDNLPHAASPADPIGHLDIRAQLGLREGGFGLMITRGMVDELNYNDVGNEVTLIKRFPPVGIPHLPPGLA